MNDDFFVVVGGRPEKEAKRPKANEGRPNNTTTTPANIFFPFSYLLLQTQDVGRSRRRRGPL